MASPNRPAFLRLVHSVDDAPRSTLSAGSGTAAQGLFFPSTNPNTLIFADWSNTSLAELVDILELSKPKVIFDFRVTPQFDLETLSRRRFFALLAEHGCQYIDLFGRAGISNVKDASANPVLIAGRVGTVLTSLPSKNHGPFIFFHDDPFFDDDYIHAFATALPALSKSWQVFSPSSKSVGSGPKISVDSLASAGITSLVRRSIFISHATPEDNDFVKWLAAKLKLAGYDVWSDITELQGGDAFWNDIETAIRMRAAKVLFIYSKHTNTKVGTRKEVFLALKTGERLRLNRFVIPVRIDDTAFDETFIELIDIQAIDCRADWLQGLRSILSLLQRDGVPKEQQGGPDRFSDLVLGTRNPTFSNVAVEETLISSWLRVERPPAAVNFYACEGIMPADLAEVAKNLDVPAFGYYALLATTANATEIKASLESRGLGYVQCSIRATIAWSDFVRAQWGDLPKVQLGDARRFTALLMNRAMADFLTRQDTRIGTLANNRPFWYFSNGKFPKNEIRFCDFKGVSIRRQLVGYSNKRRVYWHFGIQTRFIVMAGTPFYLVTPHVTFSADGKEPLASKAQLHSLRRSFCRSWWNKRWRDLLQAFSSALSNGEETVEIFVGAENSILLSSRFETFISPIAPIAAEAALPDADSEDEIEDNWDDTDEPEFDDQLEDIEGDSAEHPK